VSLPAGVRGEPGAVVQYGALGPVWLRVYHSPAKVPSTRNAVDVVPRVSAGRLVIGLLPRYLGI